MTRESIEAKVIELAAEQVDADPARVTRATHFFADLHYDSLDAINFSMAVEDEFEISIPDEDAQKLQTVGEVVDYVALRLESTASR